MDETRITAAAEKLNDWLVGRMENGVWRGKLSSSALSTAVAAFALAELDGKRYSPRISRGLDWLRRNQNPDGGWGDTIRSQSNLSTTALCWSALTLEDTPSASAEAAEKWLTGRVGSLEAENIAAAIIESYGADRTFSVPILTMCALAGKLGGDPWRFIPRLPFELSVLPRACFGIVRLPVVSYALPALIAMGLVRHRRGEGWTPIAWLRNLAAGPALRRLTTLQPANGGFLEAPPLTGFVLMSLSAAGESNHPVAGKSAGFLIESQRKDGSWPIDTDLATWLTTLAVNALDQEMPALLPAEQISSLRQWLLGQQFQSVHPFTGAAPGGWAWTDKPGGVPDADDTAGALLALRRLGKDDSDCLAAANRGLTWLLNLRNTDGGMPTFCRGWGRFQFDRSCPDITAHALSAFGAWRNDMPPRLARKLDKATAEGLKYLRKSRNPDGSWTPLWFANQAVEGFENRVYGTARVCQALVGFPTAADMIEAGRRWLVKQQNPDGGWGGGDGSPSSVEETSLALSVLEKNDPVVEKGLNWLVDEIESWPPEPAPIGLYFAKLWYFEELYPAVFAARALAGCSPS